MLHRFQKLIPIFFKTNLKFRRVSKAVPILKNIPTEYAFSSACLRVSATFFLIIEVLYLNFRRFFANNILNIFEICVKI